MLRLAAISFMIALVPGAVGLTGLVKRGRLVFKVLFSLFLAASLIFLAVGLLAGEVLF